jgi:hypothetical protein
VFGCHLWTGALDRDGYPIQWHGKTPKRAHRRAWEDEKGALPPGAELEHACRRRRCVRVTHLEQVTRSENERLKSWKARARRTTCSRGHSLWDALVTPEGGRVCRTCNRD